MSRLKKSILQINVIAELMVLIGSLLIHHFTAAVKWSSCQLDVAHSCIHINVQIQ